MPLAISERQSRVRAAVAAFARGPASHGSQSQEISPCAKVAAHVEFDRYGRHALASLWEQDGALVVYDAKTLGGEANSRE